jgi:hypothetical protein
VTILILHEGLQKFLEIASEESSVVTVEISFYRELTEEETSYINKKLKILGYFVDCHYCDTCKEYSKGRAPYHIDRRDFRFS